MHPRGYVGFGFGPIQAGLFLAGAQASGRFAKLTVAYRQPEVIARVRAAGGRVVVNVAHPDHTEAVAIRGVTLLDTGDARDRVQIAEAVAEAEAIGVALSSVADYRGSGEGSVHSLLAAGLARNAAGGGQAIVYAAENHPRAAALLQAAVLSALPPEAGEGVRARVRFVDTVIGKMSALVDDPVRLAEQGLRPIAPGLNRAFLVEPFDRILVARARLLGVEPSLPFEEKDDLEPFEEAKLYGHNASHALIAYLGALCGLQLIAELRDRPALLKLVRAALVQESGAALIAKHTGKDPLFSPAGFRAYADDLLARMMNPQLGDLTRRVARDPARKLGWDDRLIGTMRLALEHGVRPRRYALGAAAALLTLEPALWKGAGALESTVSALWSKPPNAREKPAVVALLTRALESLRVWRAAGFAGAPGAEEATHG